MEGVGVMFAEQRIVLGYPKVAFTILLPVFVMLSTHFSTATAYSCDNKSNAGPTNVGISKTKTSTQAYIYF